MAHPVAGMIVAALAGSPPRCDGGWTRVAPWRTGLEAVVAFTGHAVVAINGRVTDEQLDAMGVDGFGGAHHPRVIGSLAGTQGWIDSLDLLLARRSSGGSQTLVDREDLATHSRAVLARELRDDVRVLGLPDPRRSALVTIGRGIAGLSEISVEVEPGCRGNGDGRELVAGALAALPAGESVLAAVAPGNVASLRTLLASGFAPIASVQLYRPAGR